MAQSFSKFTDLEEHYMLGLALRKRRKWIEKAYGEDIVHEVWMMATSSWTQEQYDEWVECDSILARVCRWRTYQVCRLFATEESTDTFFPTAPPKVDFKDVKKVGIKKIKTFAIGMYARWFSRMPVNRDGEVDNEFKGKEDRHNLESGYVCKEAMNIPRFPRDDIIEELERHDQTILNITDELGRSRSR